MAIADPAIGVDREGRPSPIDVHVGSRIRLRRTLLGMSQERLGEAHLSCPFSEQLCTENHR